MTEARRIGTRSFVLPTVAPESIGPKPGIVWLDGVALTNGVTNPSYPPDAAVIASPLSAERGRGDTMSATVEVPSGSLVADVRVGYGMTTGALVSELRVVDLAGHRKSVFVLLERRDGRQLDPSADAAALFVDARSAPPGERTFVSVEASLADRSDHVGVRNLRVHLTRS